MPSFCFFEGRDRPGNPYLDFSTIMDREKQVSIFYSRAQLEVTMSEACPTDGIAPLEDWEEGPLRERAAAYLRAMNGVTKEDCEAFGSRIMAVYAPLIDEEGRPAEIDFRRSFWMHDIAHRIEELQNEENELLAMKEVADFFHDGKPFSMIRLLAMKAAQARLEDAFKYGSQS